MFGDALSVLCRLASAYSSAYDGLLHLMGLLMPLHAPLPMLSDSECHSACSLFLPRIIVSMLLRLPLLLLPYCCRRCYCYCRCRRRRSTIITHPIPQDTTWLESNVQSVRHSFFNLNPSVVQDLLELIVHHRRAQDRDQVTHKLNNVYCFMVSGP